MKEIISRHKAGEHLGICSVCSAHPLVIESALRFDLNTDSKVLIEATSNQVNQFGGYTGMKPADFRDFVYGIAQEIGFPRERLILGGEHLGPNCWQNEVAAEAMEKSVALIKAYVAAGFSKIHLVASMSCADDPTPLDPMVVAQRAAILCQAAESTATEEQKRQLTYVIGTEVPVPGGEATTIGSVHVTREEDAARTLETHQVAFSAIGLEEALTRVIAIGPARRRIRSHSNYSLSATSCKSAFRLDQRDPNGLRSAFHRLSNPPGIPCAGTRSLCDFESGSSTHLRSA